MTDRKESQFPLVHKEMAKLKIKLNGNANPLNKLLKKHGFEPIIPEYDTARNRELRKSDLENYLKRQEVEQ